MIVKIARGHHLNDKIQIGNCMYKVSQYYRDCNNECDLQHLNICRQIACNAYDRLDDRSVSFKLLGRINTPYDKD